MKKSKSLGKSAKKSANSASRRPASLPTPAPLPPAKYERVIFLDRFFDGVSTSERLTFMLMDLAAEFDALAELGINPKETVRKGEIVFETNDAKIAREHEFTKRTKEELAAMTQVPLPTDPPKNLRERAKKLRELAGMEAGIRALTH